VSLPDFSSGSDIALEELCTWLHGLLGFHLEEERVKAWENVVCIKFQVALQSIQKFYSQFSSNVVIELWLKKIQDFIGIGSSTLALETARVILTPPTQVS
jgi:hypothetical protein